MRRPLDAGGDEEEEEERRMVKLQKQRKPFQDVCLDAKQITPTLLPLYPRPADPFFILSFPFICPPSAVY
jgi:hypothetical protein